MTGDWTRYDPLITEYLNAFDRVGVPCSRQSPEWIQFVVTIPSFDELERAIT